MTRSIVRTMWAMADADGPALAGDFYKSVFSGRRQGAPYYERTVEVLRDAVVKLRRVQSFVHTGIHVALFVHVAVCVRCRSCAVLFVHAAICTCFCSCTMLFVRTTIHMRCCLCMSHLPWPRALMSLVRVRTRSKRSANRTAAGLDHEISDDRAGHFPPPTAHAQAQIHTKKHKQNIT